MGLAGVGAVDGFRLIANRALELKEEESEDLIVENMP
jgi:hypothetical protein